MTLVEFGLHDLGWTALTSQLAQAVVAYRDRAADCEPDDYPMRRGEYRAAVQCLRLVTQFRETCLRDAKDG